MKNMLPFIIFVIILLLTVTKVSAQQQTTAPASVNLISQKVITPYWASPEIIKRTHHFAVCPKINKPHTARCFARVIAEDDSNINPLATTLPAGYGPTEFHTAYNIPTTSKSAQIIAIVDAYDQPNIADDVNTYSATYNIPALPTCSGNITSASSPCFKKVGQKGTSKLPKSDGGWGLEISLDVETAHAICQNCKILLVEANSASMTNLFKAFNTAVNLGATVISNSYGGNETKSETTYDSHFNQNGIAIIVSSGDEGYGAEYPAASRYVTSVGGTKLNLNTNGTYKSETAWTDGGSGCSKYETKPTWQNDTGCKKRTIADVAADADPTTGAAVYDSFKYDNKNGWFKVGGTSLAAPLIAGMYALSDLVPSNTYGASLPYANTTAFNDIASGNNGSCSPKYLCKAGIGYDGPTGIGTPNGLSGL